MQKELYKVPEGALSLAKEITDRIADIYYKDPNNEVFIAYKESLSETSWQSHLEDVMYSNPNLTFDEAYGALSSDFKRLADFATTVDFYGYFYFSDETLCDYYTRFEKIFREMEKECERGSETFKEIHSFAKYAQYMRAHYGKEEYYRLVVGGNEPKAGWILMSGKEAINNHCELCDDNPEYEKLIDSLSSEFDIECRLSDPIKGLITATYPKGMLDLISVPKELLEKADRATAVYEKQSSKLWTAMTETPAYISKEWLAERVLDQCDALFDWQIKGMEGFSKEELDEYMDVLIDSPMLQGRKPDFLSRGGMPNLAACFLV